MPTNTISTENGNIRSRADYHNIFSEDFFFMWVRHHLRASIDLPRQPALAVSNWPITSEYAVSSKAEPLLEPVGEGTEWEEVLFCEACTAQTGSFDQNKPCLLLEEDHQNEFVKSTNGHNRTPLIWTMSNWPALCNVVRLWWNRLSISFAVASCANAAEPWL